MKTVFRKPAVVFMIFLCFLSACGPRKKSDRKAQKETAEFESLMVIETEKGTIIVKLMDDKAPRTVESILKLTSKKYFDGLTFFRVEDGKFVMAGNPLGQGGSDVASEFSDLANVEGAVGLSRLPDIVNPLKLSSASQFYICLSDQQQFDGEFTVFGMVVEGMEIVKSIAPGDLITKITVQ